MLIAGGMQNKTGTLGDILDVSYDDKHGRYHTTQNRTPKYLHN
jgi:hypothetical protein